VSVELLYVDGCPGRDALLAQLTQLLAERELAVEIEQRPIDSADAARRERFLGSPTLRIDGLDVDPTAVQRTDYGLKCRLYQADHGLRGTPPDAWVVTALDV
jgi:hypothetical protein